MTTFTEAPPSPSPGATIVTPTTTTTVVPSTSPSTLPKTGPGDVAWIVVAALVCLAIGLGVMALVGRTRRA